MGANFGVKIKSLLKYLVVHLGWFILVWAKQNLFSLSFLVSIAILFKFYLF